MTDSDGKDIFEKPNISLLEHGQCSLNGSIDMENQGHLTINWLVGHIIISDE